MTSPPKPPKQYDWYDFVQMLLGKIIQNTSNYGDLPFGLVTMATESSHRLIMGKWLNCIFSITSEVMHTIFSSYDNWMIVYPVHVFYA